MQEIDGTTINLTRGDTLTFDLSVNYKDGTNYTFQNGDKVVFSVYNKGKLTDEAVLIKEINITEESETARIVLTSEDTKIGDLINKPAVYWYEIELNDNYTVLGYDKDGAKILNLYPEGSKS